MRPLEDASFIAHAREDIPFLLKQLAEAQATITALSQENQDLKEVLEDSRRLTRELDVALCGEENAAEQASLCDLLGPAAQVRAKAQVMHDLHDSLGVAWGDDPYARIAELKSAEAALAEVSQAHAPLCRRCGQRPARPHRLTCPICFADENPQGETPTQIVQQTPDHTPSGREGDPVWRHRAEKAEIELAEVSRRLAQYGRHLDFCQMNQPSLLMAGDGPNQCTCGFSEVARRAPIPPEEQGAGAHPQRPDQE